MSAVDTYLLELARQLRCRGRARRRLLAECRDHLTDSAAALGPDEAVRRFGSPAELAAEFDTAVATTLARRSTLATVAAVLAMGASTLGLVHAASATATAVPVWAVLFFAAAQTAAVSVALAAWQLVTTRHSPATPEDLALLGRRDLVALAAATVTLVAAGGAVPGHASAELLLLGPVAVAVAVIGVVRAGRPVRRLAGYRTRVVRPPLPRLRSGPMLALTAVGAGIAALLWDVSDRASLADGVAIGGLELALVVIGYLTLGPALGLRGRRGPVRQ